MHNKLLKTKPRNIFQLSFQFPQLHQSSTNLFYDYFPLEITQIHLSASYLFEHSFCIYFPLVYWVSTAHILHLSITAPISQSQAPDNSPWMNYQFLSSISWNEIPGPLCNSLASEWESCEGNAPDLYFGCAPFEFKLHLLILWGLLQSLQTNAKQDLQ
jgi:hypothetical protein